jgi:hypothetical protein
MRCERWNIEMENGYILQLGIGGAIKIVKPSVFSGTTSLNALVCPKCGKVELHVDQQPINE